MMKTIINIESWKRKDHFRFFSGFDEPFFGVTVLIDCTHAYEQARKEGHSFFQYYLYRALKAANEIENFRYRIVKDEVWLFNQVSASPTIDRPDGTFGFGYIDYADTAALFYKNAGEVINEVRAAQGLIPSVAGQNVIHFSALPWLHFTALSHARSFGVADSAPKISFGKIEERFDRRFMPVSVHVHHGLADGYHVGMFTDRFQQLLNE